MIDFNPQHTLKPLDEYIAQTTNPRHIAILQNFREHLLAEIAGDVDVRRTEPRVGAQFSEPCPHGTGTEVAAIRQ